MCDEPGNRALMPAGRAQAGSSAAAGVAGYWFPLLLFGVLVAGSLPLSALGAPRLTTGIAVLTRVIYPTVTSAMYLGGGSGNPPFPFPLGWYWVGVLVAGSLLNAAWYRWRDLRCGGQTPVRRYLIAGFGLAVVTAALPALAWGTPIPDFPGPGAFLWLGAFWQQGTFVLLALAVNLAICAWLGRSLALAGIVAGYVAAVGLAAWLELHQVVFLPVLSPIADPAVVLPATVLMLAGLGAVTITGVQALRSRGSAGRR